MSEAVTRFAVSPTGYMHVGGARNALFDWLVVQKQGGRFILRIEDTDQAREVEGAVAHIITSLKWLGIDWHEGPDIGGPHAPYTQSERLDIYKEWAQKLIDKGLAYADPYSKEELDEFRAAAQAAKKPFLYRDHRPDNPPTWDGTQPLRLKSDPKAYSWHDLVLGDLSAGAEAVDDFVLIKSDGFPTYNFCHIVDDELMGVTHVIRSQEFTASVPRFLNLYDALGIKWPVFATLPWIMAPGGKKKLSKRDGAKDVMDYAKQGILPETMVNFLASLGWNDGTEQEIFSVQELIDKFSLDRIQRAGASFDEQRLFWMNGTHIRTMTLDELYGRTLDNGVGINYWPEEAKAANDDYCKQVLGVIQERLKYLSELPELTRFFFTDLPVDLELIDGNKQLSKLSREEQRALLEAAQETLSGSNFSAEDLADRLNKLLETTGQKPGILFSLIRIATTWAPASPGLADTMHILGKDLTLKRLSISLDTLSEKA
ncbi:MAG: glutamate--tRNA ligase [Candidatus Saccharibacteria bacterium]|nr:glutamate--tRNA ligase [Candidatus Saccharibacteria bacterium]